TVTGVQTCALPILAGRAVAARLRVIEVDGWIPGNGRVAGPALVGREDVVARLRGGAHDGADAMAGAAVGRRALEYRVDVAGLAGQVPVLTRELEAGGQVIEIEARLHGIERRLRAGRLRHQADREHQRRERGRARADRKSVV